MFTKPELAKKTVQLICKFAEMIEGRLVVERDREKRQDVADFIYLYSKQWSSKIGSIAHQTSMERRFNKKQLLPLTEDLVKIQSFLDKKIKDAEKDLLNEPGKQNWRAFANYLLTKITLFNFRRGNECAAMQVNKYLERADWSTGNSEIYNSLNKFECELAKKDGSCSGHGETKSKGTCPVDT